MNISSRRIAASGVLSLALAPALALTATPAFAGADLDAVAEGITESGYYVDSGAKYYQSDGAQELLRHAQGRSVPVFIAILAPGNDAGQVLRQLPGLMKRKGTYVVLAGDQLRATSNTLPENRVKAVYTRAVQGSKGKPDLALLKFVQTLPESKYAPPAPGKPGNNGKPAPESTEQQQEQEERTLAQSQPTAPAAGYEPAPKDDGGSMTPYLLGGGGLVVVAAAGAGFLLWRRRSATPAPAGAAGDAGTPLPGAPAPHPQGAQAQAPVPGAQEGNAPQPPAAQPPAEAPGTDAPRPPEPPKNA